MALILAASANARQVEERLVEACAPIAVAAGKPQQNAFVESFNGRLR
jgi:hypothetical protein